MENGNNFFNETQSNLLGSLYIVKKLLCFQKCDHIDSTVQLGDEEASSFKTFELCLKKNIESLKKEWMDVWIRDAYKCILQLRLRQFFTAKCNEFIK